MLVISGQLIINRKARRLIVSISQSRCLSFQVSSAPRGALSCSCFNLAIEMLVISGTDGTAHRRLQPCFNLAIEMLVISGEEAGLVTRQLFSFNLAIEMLVISGYADDAAGIYPKACFNLAIEMLVISGPRCELRVRRSRSFNLAIEMLVISGSRRRVVEATATHRVSISQSRCLSFQVKRLNEWGAANWFQSRNRDACHFRSSPHCLEGFQDTRFNLAIEMLVISG